MITEILSSIFAKAIDIAGDKVSDLIAKSEGKAEFRKLFSNASAGIVSDEAADRLSYEAVKVIESSNRASLFPKLSAVLEGIPNRQRILGNIYDMAAVEKGIFSKDIIAAREYVKERFADELALMHDSQYITNDEDEMTCEVIFIVTDNRPERLEAMLDRLLEGDSYLADSVEYNRLVSAVSVGLDSVSAEDVPRIADEVKTVLSQHGLTADNYYYSTYCYD